MPAAPCPPGRRNLASYSAIWRSVTCTCADARSFAARAPRCPLHVAGARPRPSARPSRMARMLGVAGGHGERPRHARASEGRGPQSCARRRRCMSPSDRCGCTRPLRCRRTWRCSRPTSRRAQPRRASLVAAPHAACHAACFRRPVVGLCGWAAPASPAPVTRCMALAMPVRGRMPAGHVKTARMLAPREAERARPIACAPLQTCWSCAGATLDRASPHAVDQCHAGRVLSFSGRQNGLVAARCVQGCRGVIWRSPHGG